MCESNSKPVPVYRSPKDGVPCAVEFVRCCGSDPQVLLVVETLLKREAKRKRHFLLALRRQKAADGDEGADSCRVEQRGRLTTTPTAWDEGLFTQLHALSDGRIVCGIEQIEAARAVPKLLLCIDI